MNMVEKIYEERDILQYLIDKSLETKDEVRFEQLYEEICETTQLLQNLIKTLKTDRFRNKGCHHCPYFHIVSQGEYSDFNCDLFNRHDERGHALPDINWSNEKEKISEYCPLLPNPKIFERKIL